MLFIYILQHFICHLIFYITFQFNYKNNQFDANLVEASSLVYLEFLVYTLLICYHCLNFSKFNLNIKIHSQYYLNLYLIPHILINILKIFQNCLIYNK